MSQTTEYSAVHQIHDVGYKYLLSCHGLFLELLESFIDEEWVKEIDEQSLQKFTTNSITTELKEKRADLIYQLQLKDRQVLFYIITEFQSEVNFTMPFRLLQYMLGIWNDIWDNTPKEERERKSFRLPVIVPIVIYTGRNKWTVQKNLKELLDESIIFKQVIDLPYYLIDVNRYDPEDLINLSNEIGAVFLFDQEYDILELQERYHRVSSVLKNLEPERYQKFITWFGKAVLSQLPLNNFEELLILLENSSPEEVDHVISNLAANVKRGVEKGIEQGIKKGIEQGIEEGIHQVAKNLIRKNIPLHMVAEWTELSLDEVQKLKDELKDPLKTEN